MKNKILKIFLFTIIAILILVLLYFISQYNYILFHFIAEISSIVIGVCIFLIAINTIQTTNTVFMIFMGTSFLTSSAIDFLHTLAYKGVNIFSGFDTNLPTQLWVSARFIQAVSLLAGAFIIDKLVTKRCKILIPLIFSIYFIIIILSIFIFKFFPTAYIEGVGLTPFKKITEYFIIIILIISIILLKFLFFIYFHLSY